MQAYAPRFPTLAKDAFRARYLDVLASVYIYNEHRGYTSLDRVLEAVRARCGDDQPFLHKVEKHRADERKHYLMFKHYFKRQGRMPLAVGRACGHIDHFIEQIFGCTIDDLDTDLVTGDGALFEQLCRVIMLTEQRGVKQVDILLANRMVRSDAALTKIFTIVQRDEPSHWQPYRDWLEGNGKAGTRFSERAIDFWIHKSLMLAKLPAIFLTRSTPRLTDWYDEGEVQPDRIFTR